MPSRVKVKYDPQKSFKRLDSIFRLVRRNSQLQAETKVFLEKRIKGETRRGRPYNDTRTFKALEDISIKNRRRLAKLNKTHPVFKPEGIRGKSNLTFTGQLVDSIFANPRLELKKLIFGIGVEGSREPYKTGPNSTQKLSAANSTNEALFDTLQSIGYTLFTKKGLDNAPEIKKNVNRIFLKFLRRALRVNNRLNK